MRAVLLNTGTELLAVDVHDTHLAFIAREIFSVGLRTEERRTGGDGAGIGETLQDLFPDGADIFVTGGLGATGHYLTRRGGAAVRGLNLEGYRQPAAVVE